MKLPALITEDLLYPEVATSDAMLFELLVAKPLDLIAFFEFACGDETWSLKHGPFMQETLYWMSRQVLEDKLSIIYVRQIAKAIHTHYNTVSPFVDLNIVCQLEEKSYPVSGILLVASSPILRDRLLAECRAVGSSHLTFEKIPQHLFELMIEAINKGKVENLWREEQKVILDLLKEATVLELDRIVNQCQEGLLRYISRKNVADLLELSLKEEYTILREGCLHYLDQATSGANFPIKEFERVEMEFLELSDATVDLFSRVAPLINHLAFRGGITAEALFNTVIDASPCLVGIDLSGTLFYTDRLTLLPRHLQELDLAQCGWLTDHRLEGIIQRCPQLKRLSLARNTQLTDNSWSYLYQLGALMGLDISQCHQIGDETLKLIVRACPQIEELHLDECEHLTNVGFYEIAYHAPNLRVLSVGRCHLSDAPLVEVAARCEHLELIDIRNCEGLSAKLLNTLQTLHPKLKIVTEEVYV